MRNTRRILMNVILLKDILICKEKWGSLYKIERMKKIRLFQSEYEADINDYQDKNVIDLVNERMMEVDVFIQILLKTNVPIKHKIFRLNEKCHKHAQQ